MRYRDELRKLEISVWLEQLEQLRAGSRKLLSDCEQAVRQRDAAAREQEQLYAQAEELAARMRDQDRQAEELRGRQLLWMRKSGGGSLPWLCWIPRRATARRTPGDCNRSWGSRRARAESVTTQIAQHQVRLAEIQTAWDKLNDALSQRQEQARKIKQSAGLLAEETDVLRQRENLRTATAAEARELLSALAAASRNLDRETALRGQLQENSIRLSETERRRLKSGVRWRRPGISAVRYKTPLTVTGCGWREGERNWNALRTGSTS